MFMDSLNKEVKNKINWSLTVIQTSRFIHKKYFKYINGTHGIYEIRIRLANNHYRIFCFYNNDNALILLNGFQKKTQKTPIHEIRKAVTLKKK